MNIGDAIRGPNILQSCLAETPGLLAVRDWYSNNIDASATRRSERERQSHTDAMREALDKAKALFEATDQMSDDIQARAL